MTNEQLLDDIFKHGWKARKELGKIIIEGGNQAPLEKYKDQLLQIHIEIDNILNLIREGQKTND